MYHNGICTSAQLNHHESYSGQRPISFTEMHPKKMSGTNKHYLEYMKCNSIIQHTVQYDMGYSFLPLTDTPVQHEEDFIS